MELDAPAEYHDLDSLEAGYHSVSALAIVALIVGLLSPLAFAHELLWALPIAGVAIAAVAIARIDRSEGALIGRPAAIVGLALSLLFGTGAIAQDVARRLWLARRAELVTQRFLDLMREGNSYEAHQLWTLQYRFPAGSDYQRLYSETPLAADEHAKFLKLERMADLLELGERAEVTHLRTRLSHSIADRQYLKVYYRLRGETAAGPIDKEIQFGVERVVDEHAGERWRIVTDQADPV